MPEERDVERKLQLDAKLVIFAVALLILSSVCSAFITYLFFTAANPPETVETAAEPEIPEFGPTHDIGIFTVNLAGISGPRYARVGVSLELVDPTLAPLVDARMPQVKDAIISVLSMKSATELADQEGRRQLRAEIAHKLGGILGVGNVQNVFFTEFVFQ
mgnify:CR=1 FL=1